MENDMRGVFKTTDGGRTWTPSLQISPKTGANDLAMDPSDPNTLYAAAWERQRRQWNDPRVEPGFTESGIFKTTDAGKTWTRLTNGLPPPNVTGRVGLAIARSNPNVVYAFIDNYDCDTQVVAGGRNPGGRGTTCSIKGNEVYRSGDKGASWKLVSGQDDAQRALMKGMSGTYAWVFGNIRVDPTDENTVYTLALGVSVSHDGGKTFGRIGGPPAVAGGVPPTGGAPPAAGAPPAGGGGGRGVGGDNHAMWIDPKNTNFMLSGNDSGFRVSTDGGQSWRRADLPTETFFDIAYDMDAPFRVYGSAQDHGSYRAVVDLRNGRENLTAIPFESAPGGEYCEHAIDPRNPNIVYSDALTRTDLSVPAAPRGRGGAGAGAAGRAGGGGAGAAGAAVPSGPQRTTNIRPTVGPNEDPLRTQVLAPILLSPFDPDTIYLGAQSLFRSHNRGDTWERLTGDLSYDDKTRLGDIPHQLVISLSESPKKKGLLYAGTDDGRLHVSMDDGKTWTDLTSKLPQKKWVAKVLASQYNESTVYLAQQGRYDDDFAVYLYKSTDYGQTWKSIGGNLPGGPMNMIREDPVQRQRSLRVQRLRRVRDDEWRREVGRPRRQSAIGQCHGLHRAPARPHARDRDARPRRVGDRCESPAGPIIRKLRAGMMPPKTEPQPDRATRLALVTALETTLDKAEATPMPGRRTFQRLNRAECAAAVNTMFGIDVERHGVPCRPTRLGASFDNIADAQTPSATVMQGYLRAAAAVAECGRG